MNPDTRQRLHEKLRELGATTQRQTSEVLDIVEVEFDDAVRAERERCANVLRYWLAGYAPDVMSSYEARCLAQILDGSTAPLPAVGGEPDGQGGAA